LNEVKVENLSKFFGKQKVLDNVSFNVCKNEFFTIIGPSGCGKTTLLRIIAGFETYDGDVTINNKQVQFPTPDRFIVFQDFNQLLPWKTVYGNIEFGLKLRNMKEKRKQIVEKHIRFVGLKDAEHKYPHELSGGMKQRTAIARALVMQPSILLMDEPFGSLDAQMRRALQNELIKLWKSLEFTIIFVTHNVREAVSLSDRIMVLTDKGKIKEIINVNIPRPQKPVQAREPSDKGFGILWKRIVDEI